jgi:hypothetical protein
VSGIITYCYTRAIKIRVWTQLGMKGGMVSDCRLFCAKHECDIFQLNVEFLGPFSDRTIQPEVFKGEALSCMPVLRTSRYVLGNSNKRG